MSDPIDHTRVVELYYRVVKQIEARTYSGRKLEGAAGCKNGRQDHRKRGGALSRSDRARPRRRLPRRAKTRVIVRKLLNTEVLIEHDDDGSVWALATR